MQPSLSRREREIMNIVYRRGSATAKDVLDDLPNPPGYSAVRALLRFLSTSSICSIGRTVPATSIRRMSLGKRRREAL